MEFSQQIIKHSHSPKYKVLTHAADYIYILKLNNLNCYVELFLCIKKHRDDDYIVQLNYKTALVGPYLGILDGLISLYQDKALQAITRITAKELDFFLRDRTSIPSVSYFDPKFYEILSIGKYINDTHYKNEDKVKLLSSEFDGEFIDLSFSEQIEIFEEFLAKIIYKNSKFTNFRFDLEDVSTKGVIIIYQVIGDDFFHDKLQDYLISMLSIELSLENHMIILQQELR